MSPIAPLPDQSKASAAPLGWLDFAGILAGVVLILAITVVNSHGRVFWEDEALAWVLLHDPSLAHMTHAWNIGADGGGYLYYLLGRGWFAVFGATPLTFRMLSGACFGGAFAVLWLALRRAYSLPVTAFAAANSLFFSLPLTRHFIEGRFYGLLELTVALAMWLDLRLDALPADRKPERKWFAVACLVHGALTTSHLLGVVYSAFLIAGLLLLDRRRGRWRPSLYLACMAGWLLLLPEQAAIRASGKVGKPHFWTTAPTAETFLGIYTGFSSEIVLALCVLILLAALALFRSQAGAVNGLKTAVRSRPAAWITALSVLLMPVALLIEGPFGTWLIADRYLQPLALGIAFFTAEMATLALPLTFAISGPLRRAAAWAFGLLYAPFLLFWVFHHTAQMTLEPVDYTTQLSQHLPQGVPIVTEDVFTFTNLMTHEAASGVQYTFLLDWAWAINPAAPRADVTQYHLMQNWREVGYFADHIQDADTFLREHRQFLVIHMDAIRPDPNVKPDTGNPFTERLAHDPAYTVRPYFVLDRRNKDALRDTVSLVCKGPCEGISAPASPPYCLIAKAGMQCGDVPADAPITTAMTGASKYD